MTARPWQAIVGAAVLLAGASATGARGGFGDQGDRDTGSGANRRACNEIFFIGDGMGVSTVTGTRVYSVSVDGQLVLDQFPHVRAQYRRERGRFVIPIFPVVDALVAWRNYGGARRRTMDHQQVRRAQWQIGREYLEMPGLSLNESQTRRLLGLPGDLCDAALKGLIRHGFLVETGDGTFVRRILEPTAFSVVRPVVRLPSSS
jgi:hypothetical protein